MPGQSIFCPECFHQSANAQNAHHPFDVVGQNVRRHFGADVFECLLPGRFVALHSSPRPIYISRSLIGINAGSFGGEIMSTELGRTPEILSRRHCADVAGDMSSLAAKVNGIQSKFLWAAVIALGALSFGIVALSRGENVSAAWLVVAAVCIYFIAYRFYALFIAEKVLGVDPTRQTPAYQHNDGLDYVLTNRYAPFGHHFAAIAGAGPLVGPVLAAQMGYLPGTLWILAGVVFAGAVQDMIVLFMSTRRDGHSLADMVRAEMGRVEGAIAGIGILLICIIILAVLALVVVQALKGSPWGAFTVFCTVPIAFIMGVYGRFIRRGRILEMSAIGFVLLMVALVYGRTVAESPELAPYFNLSGPTLALIIIGYGFVASVLPVWLLLAPRDYLSTFMKIGVITLLAIAIIIVH